VILSVPNFRYFIVPLVHITSAGECKEYQCRVIDENYKEYFDEILNKEEYEIFQKIMESDKYALLYSKHPKLGKMAYFKIDENEKFPIPDGLKFP
jgi:hypothetical protein